MKRTLLMAFALIICSVALQAQVTTFPWTEGFESGLNGWTTVDSDGDGLNWTAGSSEEYAHTGSGYIYSESYSMDSGEELTPDNYIFSPAIVLPDEEGYLMEYYVASYDNSTYCAEHLSVYIATGNTVASLASVTPVEEYTLTTSDYYGSGHTHHIVNLTAYAGQTVYIVFRHHNCTDMYHIIIDDVCVRQANAPVISLTGSTTAQVGIDASYSIVVTEGSLTGMTYSWSSTMESAGLATINFTDSLATISYSAGGTDTITATATNSYGTATATRVVNVIDCTAPQELPWTINLSSSSGLQCWLLLDEDGNGNNWSRSGSGSNRYLGSKGSDDWAITPPIQIPSVADGVTLEWSVRGYNNCTYEVRVSPSAGTETSDFTDSIFGETYTANSFAERSASLEAYAGQTIRVAFRHTHAASGNNNMRLRGIGVRQIGVPVISINGPSTVDVNIDTTFSITVTEGSLDGITYSWSSVMEAAGLAVITPTDSTMTIHYTAGGTDTITATATNALGTTTATKEVYVRDCSTVTNYPWSLNLTNSQGLSCWTIVDADGDGSTWSRQGSGSNRYLEGPYNMYGGPDDWIISQPLTIPEESGYVVSWSVYGNTYDVDVYYQVLVSPTASDSLASFTDTLFAETYPTSTWVPRTASLNAYSNQTIRIAFRHVNNDDDDGMRLRDIAVRQANAPAVSIVGSSTADINVATTYVANLIEGSTDELSYSWTSTMEAAGLATLVVTEDTALITYTAMGTDTLSVTATNSYGSATATRIINVRDLMPVLNLPYTTTFTDAEDSLGWQRVGGTTNKWVIGNAVGSSDSASLYISSNNGTSNAYSTSSTTDAYAYRVLNLATPGDYLFSYDWRSNGEDGYDFLRVFLAPSSFDPQGNNAMADLDDETTPAGCIALDGGGQLEGVSDWQHVDEVVTIATPGYWRLVFYWTNDASLGSNPPAAIDNVAVSVVNCPAPTNLTLNDVTAEGATLTWTPVGEETEWVVYLDGVEYQTVNSPTCSFTGLTQSTSYTVAVRAVCDPGTDTSVAVSTPLRTTCAGGNCTFSVSMNDSFGDGWNGASIQVRQGGSVIETITLSNGTNGMQTVDFCLGSSATLHWYSGSFDYEISFSVNDASGAAVLTVGDADNLIDGDTLLIFNASCQALLPGQDDPGDDTTAVVECNAPSINTTSATTTTVTMVWNGTTPAYEVAIVEGAWTAPASGTTATGHSYVFQNLTPNTQYTVGVRGVCDTVFTEWATRGIATSQETDTNSIATVGDIAFSLYPNPATGMVTVEAEADAQLAIVDLNGREVYRSSLRTTTHRVDVSTLARGAYFVRVTTEQGTSVRKLIVK